MNEIEFLNVDLLLKSKQDLTPIIDNLGKKIFVLHNGKENDHYYAYLEIMGDRSEPNEVIKIFCDLIENLSVNSKKIWDEADYRIFDIGYDSGRHENSFSSDLTELEIKRIAAINASMRITIYPSDNS